MTPLQAAKSPGSANRSTIVISDDEEDEAFFSSGGEQASFSAPRPSKRARTFASNATTPRRSNGGGRSNACGKFAFTKLPDAIQAIVMSWASPRDLLRLAWTSKSIARVLMSRSAAHIWKSARECMREPMPACPDDVCELRWAHLTFGPAHCFTCGAPNIHSVIFAFRRRACVPCMKANMVWEKKFGDRFPDQEKSVLALLPHSNIGPNAHGHSSKNKFFWVPDEALKRWKADRMLEAVTIVEEAQGQIEWGVEQVAKQRPEPGADNRAERKQIVEAKLLELRWEIEDIESIYYEPKSNPVNPELTTAAWTRIWKEVEPKLQEKRRKRMRQMAGQAFERFRATLPAGHWRTFPAVEEVLTMPPFAALLSRDVTEPVVTAADYDSAAKETRQLAAVWSSKQKKRLAEGVILPSFTGDRTLMVAAGVGEAELAVSVFVCHSNTTLCLTFEQEVNGMKFPKIVLPLIGVTEALGHERLHRGTLVFESPGQPWQSTSPATSPSVEFSPRGSFAAISLLALLSLNPATARPLDVDNLNARFRCAHCLRLQPQVHGHVVMDWRRCIAHHLTSDSIPNHPPQPSWTLLNPEETQAALQAAVRTSERAGDYRRDWLFVIARVQGRYRCIASFHSQWLSGSSVPEAAGRLVRAFVNPFNAAAIASELSTISEAALEAFAREYIDVDDYEHPAVLCPYLAGLFMTCCRVDMEKGFLYRLSLQPISILPSECDNNDGYTCFDLTESGKPRYCFWWPDGGPLNARQYLGDEDDERIDRAVPDLLGRCSLLDVSTLAEAWPADFGPLLQHSRPSDVEAEGPAHHASPPPLLSALSAASTIQQILSSRDDDESETLVTALASLVVQKSYLEVLRRELLAADKPTINGVRLLKMLLTAEKSSVLDLRPWISRGFIDATSLHDLSEALQHADSIDLSSSPTLTAEILQAHVVQWPNIKSIVALGCPLLGPLAKALPITSYLASEPLRAAVEQTRLRRPDLLSAPECIRWAEESDAPAGLSVFLYCPPLISDAASMPPKRFGVELAHFGVEGVIRGFTRFLERLYKPIGWFDYSGFYFEMRAYFHPTGAVAVSDCIAGSSDGTASYSFGCLPSLIIDIPYDDIQEDSDSESPAVYMPPSPRHPGWVLVLDTKGTMPYHKRSGLYTSSPPEYAFERWDTLSDGDKTEVLRPVESISVRDWVGRLPGGHGAVSDTVLVESEAVLARLNVGLRGTTIG
ncbi:hypothetical protein AURDEDRAFT_164871 [Auricularia subglabra TFB-10046 SS5]|nr:hypothetical protein AURDEDRAFT_164871 [Auricularia subglabra TFB-10046 SS5]